jgi:hypothetical protein
MIPDQRLDSHNWQILKRMLFEYILIHRVAPMQDSNFNLYIEPKILIHFFLLYLKSFIQHVS